MSGREIKEFDLYGVTYRTTQFSASDGFKMIGSSKEQSPTEALQLTEVCTESGEWLPLSKPQNINRYVKDVIGFVSAHVVLSEVMGIVRLLNFEFYLSWSPVKIPKRFIAEIDQSKVPQLPHIHPIMSRLVTEKLATLKELTEFYSLKDAFDLYDMSCADALKSALGNEAAMKKAEADAKSKKR